MNLRFFIFFILYLPLQAFSQSEILDFYLIKSKHLLADFLFPVPKGESPEKALKRYLSQLERSPEMMDLFYGEKPQVAVLSYEQVNDLKGYAISIANKSVDYTLESPRVSEFRRLFEKSGYQYALLPLGIDLYLSRGQTRELMQKLAEQVPVLNSMGGEDVDPRFYRKENFHSLNTNAVRDRFEIALIQKYTSQEKGFFIGVCRGAQIASVALGYQLVQDISFQLQTQMNHGDSWHPIVVQKTSFNYLHSIFSDAQGQTSKTSPDGKGLMIRSIHHQMISYVSGGPLELAAVGPDGVVEALEFKNGRGVLMQFHPELMQNSFGDQIFTQILKKADILRQAPRCYSVFK